MPKKIIFEQLFDAETWTYTYLIADPTTKEAAIVDSVREQSSVYVSRIKELGLNLKYLIETHVHADHITANSRLQEAFPSAKIALSEQSSVKCESIRLKDNDTLFVGDISIQALYTPGHTSESMSFLVDENRLLTGDTLLIGSCGRTDFQAGDTQKMFDSLKRLMAFPPDTLIYPGHDYNKRWVSSVREELDNNKLLSMNFNEFKTELDNWKLPPPRKLKESVPGNLECGKDA